MVRTILRLLADGDDTPGRLAFVDDQHGCPTFTADLAPMLRLLALERRRGVHHVTNQGPVTWFEFAQAVATVAGRDPAIVRPISTAELDPPRPPRARPTACSTTPSCAPPGSLCCATSTSRSPSWWPPSPAEPRLRPELRSGRRPVRLPTWPPDRVARGRPIVTITQPETEIRGTCGTSVQRLTDADGDRGQRLRARRPLRATKAPRPELDARPNRGLGSWPVIIVGLLLTAVGFVLTSRTAPCADFHQGTQFSGSDARLAKWIGSCGNDLGEARATLLADGVLIAGYAIAAGGDPAPLVAALPGARPQTPGTARDRPALRHRGDRLCSRTSSRGAPSAPTTPASPIRTTLLRRHWCRRWPG